jgi:putative chitinase
MALKIADLQKIMNAPVGRVRKFHPDVLKTMDRYAINTPLRMAHFLAQLGHESGALLYVEEIWPNPGLDAKGVATRGNKWQLKLLKYEGRRDLGNTQVGGGYRFRGRGLIQLTGRANYESFGKAVGKGLVSEKNPDKVAQLPLAVSVAGWFWDSPKLNKLADRDDVEAVTKKINGGLNGLVDRKKYLTRARQVLFVDVPVVTYKIVKGDTLGKIAKARWVTLAKLLAANPEIKDANKIKVGQVVRIPG